MLKDALSTIGYISFAAFAPKRFGISVSLNRSITLHHTMSSQFSAFEWASGEVREEG